MEKQLLLTREQLQKKVWEETRRYRCYRCGNEKSGLFHTTNAKSNTKEYCMTPLSCYVKHWVTPIGYRVGDQPREKKFTQREMKDEWKRIRAINGIPEDENWKGW